MIYTLELEPHPTDPVRQAFRIVVIEATDAAGLGPRYGVYITYDALLVALEALLRMEASR